MNLFEQINEDIKSAMKGKEEARLRTLRAIKSAMLLAKTEKGAADELSSEKEIQILQKLVKQRKESYDIYVQQNRKDLAEIEFEEMAIIEKYLPAQIDESQLRSIIKEIIARTGASSVRDIGKVMGAATKELAGKADGKTISAIAKEMLDDN